MKFKIEKGDRFKCIKDFVMESDEVSYTKGKEYISEVDKCISDNEGDVNHQMGSYVDNFFEYFKLIYKK